MQEAMHYGYLYVRESLTCIYRLYLKYHIEG
jgi:hypothetical protein